MEELKRGAFATYLKPRPRDAHKGECGHVLVIGGDNGFSGAPRLAGEAALRAGAGLVSVASRSEYISLARPEIMSHAVETAADLKPLFATATVIILGPGLRQAEWGKALFTAAIKAAQPLIVDADGLNLLAENPQKNSNWILTPHPGEAGRLLKKTTEEIQKDRVAAVKELQQKYGGVVVLKGAGSLVAVSETDIAICADGNPGMASGGMGDALSGLIGGLVAQSMPLDTATKLGVLVHAMAGDLAAQQGERGMIASDLLPHFRTLLNR